MKRTILAATLAAALAGPAFAQAPAAPATASTSAEYPVLSGGVGLDERQAMDAQASNFNLKLAFAAPGGEYFDNVGVMIARTNGAKVYEGTSEGPWFFIKLPPGRYTVAATMNGKTIHRNVRVPQRSASKLHFYFPE